MRRLVVGGLLSLLIVACGVDDPVGGDLGFVDSNREDAPEADLFEQPIADASDPGDRAGASDNFVDCTGDLWQGGWTLDVGPSGSARQPQDAVALFLDLWALPTENYELAGRDDNRLLYTHMVGGVPKIAVIVADASKVDVGEEDGWAVETFAACDPAEYDPSTDAVLPMDVWVDAVGKRVPTSILNSSQGPGHCDWESVTFLYYEGRQYVGDPNGAFDDNEFVVPFNADTELPPDAADTGYNNDGRQLWISQDATVAFIVDEDSVEAWPTPVHPIGCD